MTLPSFATTDYQAAFLALMPSGKIWDKSAGSVVGQVVGALVPTYQRMSDRAINLITDTFVGTTQELLPQWEASLGLPDLCITSPQTVEQRVQHCVARFVGLGGQSIAFFTAYALSLGYPITIGEFSPFYADRSVGDGLLWSEIGAYVWQVNSPSLIEYLFSADVSDADDALAIFGNNVIPCEFNRLAPAHTSPIYNVTGVNLINPA
jgi:uncharacterized protein YmfQ (DUF2313 family)